MNGRGRGVSGAAPASRLRVPPTTHSTASASCRCCSSRMGACRNTLAAREEGRACAHLACLVHDRQSRGQAGGDQRSGACTSPRQTCRQADMRLTLAGAGTRGAAACMRGMARQELAKVRMHTRRSRLGGKRRAAGRQAGTCINSASSCSIRAASRASAPHLTPARKLFTARLQPAPRCCQLSTRLCVRRLAQMVLHACDEGVQGGAHGCAGLPHDPRPHQHQALAWPTDAPIGTPARTSSRTLVHVLLRGRVSLGHGLRGTGHLEVACAPRPALGPALTRTSARGHEGMRQQSAGMRQDDEKSA